MKRLFLLLAAVGGAACATTQGPPIILRGDPVAIASLAGEWEGSYWSRDNDRRGTLSFSLKAGTDSAWGDVTMITPLGQEIFAADGTPEHKLHSVFPQSLHIGFVRITTGGVSGDIEPYIAPDCNCVVTTRFTGAEDGTIIRGTYTTSGRWSETQTGFWQMSRRQLTAAQ